MAKSQKTTSRKKKVATSLVEDVAPFRLKGTTLTVGKNKYELLPYIFYWLEEKKGIVFDAIGEKQGWATTKNMMEIMEAASELGGNPLTAEQIARTDFNILGKEILQEIILTVLYPQTKKNLEKMLREQIAVAKSEQ